MPYALCPMPYALCPMPYARLSSVHLMLLRKAIVGLFIFYDACLYNLFNSFYFFNIYLDNSRSKFYAHNSADFEDFYKTGTLR